MTKRLIDYLLAGHYGGEGARMTPEVHALIREHRERTGDTLADACRAVGAKLMDPRT